MPFMKKLFLSVFVLCYGFVCEAQPLYVHWTRFIGGQFPESAYHAINTHDSSIVFVGVTSDTMGLYDIPAAPNDSFDILPQTLLVAKMDSSKQLAWVKTYGGSRGERGVKVAELSDGTYAVLGYTASYDGDIPLMRGAQDIWLLKLDSHGNIIWQKTYGSSSSDIPFSFTTTSDGGFLIAAGSMGSDYDVPFHYGAQIDMDWLVIKTDSLGDLEWSRTLGGTNFEGRAGSIFEADGGYYLVSHSNSSDYDCNDSSWHNTAHSDMDYYMLKLDLSGNVLWSKSYGGSDFDQVSYAMWDERDSSIVITGDTKSIDYMVQNNTSTLTRSIWVVKTDKDGNFLWGRRIGDTVTNNDAGNILPYDNNGYVLAGTAYAAFQLQPGRIGSMDAWLFFLDSLGNPYYDKIIGGTSQEVPTATVVSFKSGFSMVGITFSYVFAEGENFVNNHSNVSTDIFVSALLGFPSPTTIPNDITQARILSVYPNPADGKINIELPVGKQKGSLTVFDQNGKKVYDKQYTGKDRIEINTGSWAKGIYTVQWFTNKGETFSSKVINN